jgi:Tol biopolymer transport system component
VRIRQLTWYNLEDGNETGKLGDPVRLTDTVLSPDEHHAAAVVWSGKSSSITSERAIWIYDLARGASTRLTFAAGAFDNPVWSPDGQTVYFVNSRDLSVLRKAVSGDSDPTKIFSDNLSHGLCAVTPDGQLLAIASQIPRDFRIDLLPLQAAPVPVTFLGGDSNFREAVFSPDGKWVSYMSDQTGRYELYVTTYPDHKGKWQITKEGLSTGGWLKSPNQLAYVGGDSKLYIVDVAIHGADLEVLKTRNAFGGRQLPALPQFMNIANAITKDGKRLLFPKPMQDNKQNLLTLLTNWSADLKKP